MAVPVRFEGVIKTFGTVRALDSVSLSIEAGELFFLLGPSGCGKTTLLRSLAGFCLPDSGGVYIGERDVTHLPPHRRDTGMVFQSYALWPHMTLFENVAFGLEMRRTGGGELRERVHEALAMVRLDDRAQAKPNQLSGGQQQRVALARALVIKPQCLLLDEPLSNLDAKLRLEMRSDIRRICKQAGITALYVTHDQKEALSIADRLAVMRAGKIEQIGTPGEVYRQPANKFVAGFIGEGNFIGGRVVAFQGATLQVETAAGLFTAVSQGGNGFAPGDAVSLCIRPEALELRSSAGEGVNLFRGELRQTIYQGEVAQHEIALPAGSGVVVVKVFELNPRPVEGLRAVTCQVAPEQVIVLPGGGQE